MTRSQAQEEGTYAPLSLTYPNVKPSMEDRPGKRKQPCRAGQSSAKTAQAVPERTLADSQPKRTCLQPQRNSIHDNVLACHTNDAQLPDQGLQKAVHSSKPALDFSMFNAQMHKENQRAQPCSAANNAANQQQSAKAFATFADVTSIRPNALQQGVRTFGYKTWLLIGCNVADVLLT